MPFFEFDQNNSFGKWVESREKGLAQRVIIEAETLGVARARAVNEIGIYFNGVRNGIDCSCCGDRWYSPYDEDGTDQPEIYGETVTAEKVKESGYNTAVHPESGPFVWYDGQEN